MGWAMTWIVGLLLYPLCALDMHKFTVLIVTGSGSEGGVTHLRVMFITVFSEVATIRGFISVL